MRESRDAKSMAKNLRAALARQQIEISHSQSLELVAAQCGYENWNVLAAKNAAGEGAAFKTIAPILRIFDVEKAKDFYLGFLGFTLDWGHRFGKTAPLYAQVSRAGLTLHLSEHHGDGSPGSAVFVYMNGIQAYHEELASRQYSYMKPGIEELPWGKMMTVVDPFSNSIRFCEQT